jgi:5'-3' exonuclease
MGIKDYHSWIKATFPNAVIETTKNNIYEYIYIDMNYVLHYSIYGCKTIDAFIQNIYFNLDILFMNFIATKKIFFALDGTPAYAKIILQRERRQDTNSSAECPQNLDHLGLSVGTKMMKKLENKIQMYIDNLYKTFKYTKPELKFSKSSECDEGEIKICREIILNGTYNLSHRHLIIGNDADIIVLSMGAKPIYNINILVNENGNKNRMLISLKLLLESFAISLNKNSDMCVMANNNLRDDFVIVSLMMGNDYFPKLAFINYIKLWEFYYIFAKECNDTIINNGKFNIENFKKFAGIIYSNMNTGKTITVNTYDKDRVTSYLEGLLWCLKIYNSGNCDNYEYAYTGMKSVHPYELYIHLLTNDVTYNEKFSLPVSSDIYSLLIMPASAKHLISPKYYDFMDNELKYLYDMENCIECKQFFNTCKIAKTKVNNCKSNMLLDKFKENYRNKYLEYSAHKKTHTTTFGPDDIKYIINLCDKIK